ncbi:hypothetical protein [Salinibacter sp. 10B]|uniref:hypothetical protein n=1 Tax=Salinibacter sp. 10B TaxID=1923971 RepID=UPI0011B0E6E2|nr:hypothetical protein [Salinibacter sp. 10B]
MEFERDYVLLTDHYHQHIIPLAEEAYVLWQKQCHPLDNDASMHDQLVAIGSLREEVPSPS